MYQVLGLRKTDRAEPEQEYELRLRDKENTKPGYVQETEYGTEGQVRAMLRNGGMPTRKSTFSSLKPTQPKSLCQDADHTAADDQPHQRRTESGVLIAKARAETIHVKSVTARDTSLACGQLQKSSAAPSLAGFISTTKICRRFFSLLHADRP